MNVARYLVKFPLLRRLVPSLKKRWAKHTAPKGYILRMSQGALFLLNYRNFVDRQIAFYGTFENRQFDYFAQEMAQQSCDLFCDIGANIGYYSVLVAHRKLAHKILAFEPDERNLRQFMANTLMNGLVGHIDIVAKPVTSCSGPIRFTPSSDQTTGMSHVGDGPGSQQIEGVALDDMLNVSGRCIFMKIDIEGHELEALQGMEKLLKSNRIFLQIESFRSNAVALEKKMHLLGYRHCLQIDDDHYFRNF